MPVTITFTQCDASLEIDDISAQLTTLPVIERCRRYEAALDEPTLGNWHWRTYDELLILIAQHACRNGKLRGLRFFSQCNCNDARLAGDVTYEVKIDDDGDLSDGMAHGFFPQRLKYLMR